MMHVVAPKLFVLHSFCFFYRLNFTHSTSICRRKSSVYVQDPGVFSSFFIIILHLSRLSSTSSFFILIHSFIHLSMCHSALTIINHHSISSFINHHRAGEKERERERCRRGKGPREIQARAAQAARRWYQRQVFKDLAKYVMK